MCIRDSVTTVRALLEEMLRDGEVERTGLSLSLIHIYGTCTLPMDEALILAAVDISGRPAVGYAPVSYTHLARRAMFPIFISPMIER